MATETTTTFLTTAQIADLLGVTGQTVREKFRDGSIEGAEQVGGRGAWVLPRPAARRFLQRERDRLLAQVDLIEDVLAALG